MIEHVLGLLTGHIEHRTPYDVEYRLRHNNGHYVYIRAMGQAMWDAEKHPIRMVGSIEDITGHKETEIKILQNTRDLEQKNKELEELLLSNAQLDEFAYIASHDLKAPLRVIDNASRWLEEDLQDQLSGETRENMELLRGRVHRMERLLDDLLEYSRVGKNSDERSNEAVVGDDMMDDIRQLLSIPEGFIVKISPSFAKISVKRMPLQQILLNLISNSIKHHDKKAGLIKVTVHDAGTEYQFEVSDDGPGIAPEFHEQIFKMFQTLKPRDQTEGSGMGLAIVRKNIELYGGRISLESAEEKGSTFRFSWPKKQHLLRGKVP